MTPTPGRRPLIPGSAPGHKAPYVTPSPGALSPPPPCGKETEAPCEAVGLRSIGSGPPPGALTGSLLPFLQGGGSDDTELRYSTQYEERLDPFSSFSKRVRGPAAGQPGAPTSSPGLGLPVAPLHQPWSHPAPPHTHCTVTPQTTRAAPTLTLVPGRPGVHQGRPGTPADADGPVRVCSCDPVNPRCALRGAGTRAKSFAVSGDLRWWGGGL